MLNDLKKRFVVSEKRTNVLPHMPPDRRKFVHDVCATTQVFFFLLGSDVVLFL